MAKRNYFSCFHWSAAALALGLVLTLSSTSATASTPLSGTPAFSSHEPTGCGGLLLGANPELPAAPSEGRAAFPVALPAGAKTGYLIVASETLVDEEVFNDFVVFKRGLGFEVFVKTIEWIDNSLPGDDFPERLRNHLQIAYEAHTSGPQNVRYALLVGNKDDIPFRRVYPRCTICDPEEDSSTITDWYYADLTGDWDSNGNGLFGEGMLLDDPTDEADLHYEVAIGRLPFSGEENVRLALDTIMAFERDGGAWKARTLQAGAFMEFTGQAWSPLDDPDGSYHAHGDKVGADTDNAILMEVIWNEALQPAGMSRTRLFETGLNANGVPHSSYTAEFPLAGDNLVAAWNEEDHGLVNLAGHGNEWAVYQYQWETEIEDNDTINQPTRPLDTGDGRLVSRYELSGFSYLHANDLDLLDVSEGLAPVVAVAGCGTANAEHGNGLGVTFLSLGKASAFFGSLGTTGYEPAWAANTGKGVGQDILLRFNQVLMEAFSRVGDATYQTMMQLFDEAPGEPRGRALVKQVLYGDPAMSYWGAGAEFDSPWPMFRHDIQNSGLTAYSGPALGAVRWTFPLNPVPFTNGVSSPIVGPDGTIYAGNAQGILYAINPDGTEKWQFQAGGAINASPILTVSGTLYFRAEDGYLYAVDNSGELLWNAPMEVDPGTAGPTPGQPPFSNSPRVTSDGTVLALATIDLDGGFSIYNGYRPNGQRLWAEQESPGAAGTPAIAQDGTIYFTYWDGTLNTGFDFGAPSIGSPAIGNDGSIFVGNINGSLVSISPAMAENWRYNVAGTINDINSSPAVGEDGSVYFGVSNNKVYALNSNGTLRWKYDTGGPVDSSPALDEGAVYVVGGPDGQARLYALDRSSGDLLWFVTIGGRSVLGSSPAIGYGKMVYVVSQDGRLFAIGPAGPLPPSDALAQAVSPFEIDISWRDNSTDEVGFRLERRKGWLEPYEIIATLSPNETFFPDKDLPSDQTYFYRVLALGSAYSGYTNVTHAHTPPPVPGSPAGLTAASESSYSVRLQWNPLDSGALGVEIYRSSTAAGPFIRVGLVPGDVKQFVDTNPVVESGGALSEGDPRPGQNYVYRIRAFNETGRSSYALVTGQTFNLNLDPPPNLQAVVHDFSYVKLTWGVGPTSLTGYVVERASGDMPGFEVIATLSATATSYEDHALDSGYHTYRIRAFNSTSNSPFVISDSVHIPETVRKVYLPVARK